MTNNNTALRYCIFFVFSFQKGNNINQSNNLHDNEALEQLISDVPDEYPGVIKQSNGSLVKRHRQEVRTKMT